MHNIFLHLIFCIVNVSFCKLTNSGKESSAVWCAVTLSNLIIYALTRRDIRSLSCFSKLAAFKSDWRKCIGPSHLCALLQSNWILKRLLKRGELNLHKVVLKCVRYDSIFFFVKMTGVETAALPKWLTQIYWSISSLCIAAVKLDLEKTFEARRTKS